MLVSMQNINYKPAYSSSLSFNGYTKKLGKQMYIDGKKDIKKIIEAKNLVKKRNTIVGKVPPIIFNAIKPDEREKKIREVFKTFSEVSDEIRLFRPTSDKSYNERKNRRPDSVVEKLRNLFLDLKIIKPDDNFDLIFLGEGNYKKAYKIDGVKDPITNEELCYKVFHIVDNTPEWHKYKTHGNFAELNTAMYWMKTFGYDTQRGKYYFGDIDNGYFVDKFIDNKVNAPKRFVSEEFVGVKLTDEVAGYVGHNRLHGYSIDPGGPRVVNRVKNQSKLARKIFNTIKNLPKESRMQEWYNILSKDDNWNLSQKRAGLALSIKHLNQRSKPFDECLAFEDSFVDMALAYVLKYQKLHNAKKNFKTLLDRNDPEVQTVVLNEIPLLAREKIKIDDLDVPRGQINSQRLYEYYKLAQERVLPEVEQHLCSYIHLLPDDKILPEAQILIDKSIYENIDRLLHKIKFVKDEEFSYGNKMTILGKLDSLVNSSSVIKKADGSMPSKEEMDFIKQKLRDVRVYVIRNQLED